MNLTKMNKAKGSVKSKVLTVSAILSLLIASILCWLLLETIVLISIDDTMYAGWTEHGIKHFFDKNTDHYLNFNGRFIIHLFASLILVFEEHLYAIIFPFFISVSTFLITYIAKKEWQLYKRLFAAAFSLLLYMSLSYKFLTPTALWIVGGFNYVFPLLAVTGFYFLFLRQRKSTQAMLWLLPFAFVCGATTEQYGMYTVGLITLTYFFDTIENKKLDKRAIAYFLTTVAGLMTVILAPPTLKRFSETADRSLIEGFLYNWSFIDGKESENAVLPILFMLIPSLFALYSLYKSKKTKKKPLYSPILIYGLPTAILLYIASSYKNHTVSAILTVAYAIILVTTMLKNNATRELGKISLCGFGTFIMMSFTSMASSRTALPCILSFIIVIAIMSVEIITEIKIKFLSGAITVVAIVLCCINYGNSYTEYKRENLVGEKLYKEMITAKETEKIEFDFDETIAVRPANYRNMNLTDVYPLKYYKEKFDIPNNVKYIISSKKYTVHNISVNGLYSQLPAARKNSEIYVPLTLDCLALCIEKNVKTEEIHTENGNFIGLSANGKMLECSKDDVLEVGHLKLVKIDVLVKKWGYTYTYDESENTLIFSKQ